MTIVIEAKEERKNRNSFTGSVNLFIYRLMFIEEMLGRFVSEGRLFVSNN